MAARRTTWILVGAFAISRLAYYLAGVRFDASVLDGRSTTDAWQLLDVGLLHHDLLSSVWHLHSQPPLFNLFCGALLHLPGDWRTPVAAACYLLLGLVLTAACYLVMVELRVPRWVALVATLILVASPSNALFESWLFYAYPSAALLTLSALCCVRFLRRRTWGYGVGFFASVSAVVLLNSTYQIEWLVVAAVVVVLALRSPRRVALVAALPVLAVLAWYLKDAAMFGTTSTSSWLGMNLAKVTLARAPKAQLRHLVANGALRPIALVAPFSAPGTYEPRFVRVRATGIASLDERTKADGSSNLNNLVYVPVSSRYLSQDLAYIAAEPGTYLRSAGLAFQIWVMPTDQYTFVLPGRRQVAGWARLYDRFVLGQPEPDLVINGEALFGLPAPTPAQLPYGTFAMLALALLGAPVLAWRWRRSDPASAAAIAYVWMTVVYSLVATSLLDVGENNRFRFELGPLPLVLAAVVAVALVRGLLPRLRPIRSHGRPSLRPDRATPVPVSWMTGMRPLLRDRDDSRGE